MNTHNIELPPLPDLPAYSSEVFDREVRVVSETMAEQLMHDYARAAIELYQRRIEELESQLEAIGAGGVSSQRITSPSRGEPWMPVESCPGGNGVRYLFVRDCGQGTLPAVEMGYMLDADTEVYMDSTHEPFTKYGYRVTHWTHLPGLPNTPQPAEPVKSTCKKCNGTGVESTRFHGVWPNGEECLEPIKCDQGDGFGTTSAAEPVKVPPCDT